MIPKVRLTSQYKSDVSKIKNRLVAKFIRVAPPRIAVGLGDNKNLSSGIYEYRIHVGPGYRIYYSKTSNGIILLCIGDKSSQNDDIALAKRLLLSL